MLFYTSPIEREELEKKAREAVEKAILYVEKDGR